MTTKKQTRKKTAEAGTSLSVCAALAVDGAERLIETTRLSINLAARQNAEIVGAVRKVLQGTSWCGLSIFDLTERAVEGYIAAQNKLLDLTVEQVHAVADTMLNSGASAETASAKFTGILLTSVERSSAAQNAIFDFAVERTRDAMATVKAQPGFAGTDAETITDGIQRGFDTLVAAEKEILDLTNKQFKSVVDELTCPQFPHGDLTT